MMHRLAYPPTRGITIKTELPAEGRTEAMAEAFQAAITIAATDPDTRLRMILGEAHARYREVCRWVQQEIEQDEAKAPGLVKRANYVAFENPTYLPNDRSMDPVVALAQLGMLQEAMASLNRKLALIEHKQKAEGVTIDHEPGDVK